jgi:hypothetical protein
VIVVVVVVVVIAVVAVVVVVVVIHLANIYKGQRGPLLGSSLITYHTCTAACLSGSN